MEYDGTELRMNLNGVLVRDGSVAYIKHADGLRRATVAFGGESEVSASVGKRTLIQETEGGEWSARPGQPTAVNGEEAARISLDWKDLDRLFGHTSPLSHELNPGLVLIR